MVPLREEATLEEEVVVGEVDGAKEAEAMESLKFLAAMELLQVDTTTVEVTDIYI